MIIISIKIWLYALVVMLIAPILTCLITAFFTKKNPLHAPTKFDLLSSYKWDKKLNRLLKFRHVKLKAINKRKNKNLDEENENIEFDEDGIYNSNEPSVSISFYQNHTNNEHEHDNLIGQFDLIKLAPIQIQERINNIKYDKNGNACEKYKQFVDDAHKAWPKTEIIEENFINAADEKIQSSSRLFDLLSY